MNHTIHLIILIYKRRLAGEGGSNMSVDYLVDFFKPEYV